MTYLRAGARPVMGRAIPSCPRVRVHRTPVPETKALLVFGRNAAPL
jgi:hypothetical protein